MNTLTTVEFVRSGGQVVQYIIHHLKLSDSHFFSRPICCNEGTRGSFIFFHILLFNFFLREETGLERKESKGITTRTHFFFYKKEKNKTDTNIIYFIHSSSCSIRPSSRVLPGMLFRTPLRLVIL